MDYPDVPTEDTLELLRIYGYDDDHPSDWEREQARLMVLPSPAPERSWFVQRVIDLFQQMARGTSVRSW